MAEGDEGRLADAYDNISSIVNRVRSESEALVERICKTEHGSVNEIPGIVHLGAVIGFSVAMNDELARMKAEYGSVEEEIHGWLSLAIESGEQWREARIANWNGPVPLVAELTAER